MPVVLFRGCSGTSFCFPARRDDLPLACCVDPPPISPHRPQGTPATPVLHHRTAAGGLPAITIWPLSSRVHHTRPQQRSPGKRSAPGKSGPGIHIRANRPGCAALTRATALVKSRDVCCGSLLRERHADGSGRPSHSAPTAPGALRLPGLRAFVQSRDVCCGSLLCERHADGSGRPSHSAPTAPGALRLPGLRPAIDLAMLAAAFC